MESKFRELQNREIEMFANRINGDTVYELGGTFKENNKKYFVRFNKFVIGNIIEGECDEIEDITNLSYLDNSIDSVICISVLQHVFDFNQAISEIIRVLKPGGKALITNGFLFPICMTEDYVRLTPRFWEIRLSKEPVKFEIKKLGNRYNTIENLLMRPYGRLGGLLGLVNKFFAQFFIIMGKINSKKDAYPLGLAVYIEKNI
jgi:SAM-dependent methyltransferase